MTFPRTEAGIFAAAKERAAQPVGQSRIARVRVSRVSRLSRRAATTDLDGHVRTGSELPHGPRGSTSMQMALVSVYVGSTAVGQGLETVMAQIAADTIGKLRVLRRGKCGAKKISLILSIRNYPDFR